MYTILSKLKCFSLSCFLRKCKTIKLTITQILDSLGFMKDTSSRIQANLLQHQFLWGWSLRSHLQLSLFIFPQNYICKEKFFPTQFILLLLFCYLFHTSSDSALRVIGLHFLLLPPSYNIKNVGSHSFINLMNHL